MRSMMPTNVTVPGLNITPKFHLCRLFQTVPNLCQDGGVRGCPGQGGVAPSGPALRGGPLQPDGQDRQSEEGGGDLKKS